MKNIFKTLLLSFMIFSISSCDDYLEVPYPTDQLTSESTFGSKSTINAAVLGMYYWHNFSFIMVSKSYNASLMSDEIVDTQNVTSGRVDLSNAQIEINNAEINFWDFQYNVINRANLILEQLPNVGTAILTTAEKNAFLGEAYYLRAANYFDLVNTYGDVPLVTTTDINDNISSPRSPKAKVNELIEKDLLEATKLLPATIQTYKNRISNKYQAYALLSRFYLYQAQWDKAESTANEVINQSAYQLPALLDAFKRNSAETIFSTGNSGPTSFVYEGKSTLGILSIPLFAAPTAAQAETTAVLYTTVLNLLPPTDPRRTNWVITLQGRNFPFKYIHPAAVTVTTGQQDWVRQRLAEVYLNRAEAKAMQDKLDNVSGALFDLNKIRTRAGVPNITGSLTKAQVMAAIEEERIRELFAEGFRWFDLKRWGKADAVLSVLPHKAANYKPYMKLWPIANNQLIRNPNLTQTPGYETQ